MRSPSGYDLTRPKVMKLPLELDEISGISYSAKDSSLLAINDERGWLYKIFPAHPKRIERWHFGPGGDYEDIAIHDSTIYVLRSKGVISVFRFHGHADSMEYKEVKLDEKHNEFETLYWSERQQRVVMLCKDCEEDKKKTVSYYLLAPDSNKFVLAPTAINADEITDLLNEKPTHLKFSAGGIHPLTGEIFLISAVNKILVVLDKDYQVQDAYRLNPAYFKQPEGLTFSPNGDLYISNEAAEVGVANILIFSYKQQQAARK